MLNSQNVNAEILNHHQLRQNVVVSSQNKFLDIWNVITDSQKKPILWPAIQIQQSETEEPIHWLLVIVLLF